MAGDIAIFFFFSIGSYFFRGFADAIAEFRGDDDLSAATIYGLSQ
jgi:hypothetical protein